MVRAAPEGAVSKSCCAFVFWFAAQLVGLGHTGRHFGADAGRHFQLPGGGDACHSQTFVTIKRELEMKSFAKFHAMITPKLIIAGFWIGVFVLTVSYLVNLDTLMGRLTSSG